MENGQEVEKETKHNLLAEGSYSLGSEIQDGYPEFTLAVLKKLGWDKDLTPQELAVIQRVGRQQSGCRVVVDRPVRRHPAGGDEARLHPLRQRQGARQCVRNLPDAIPVHREPIYTPRLELVAKYPTLPNRREFRLPKIGFTSRRPTWRRGSPTDSRSSSPPAGWSNTRAAAKRPAPTSGSPSCSRTCSSRSIRPMPPSAASRTAGGSG